MIMEKQVAIEFVISGNIAGTIQLPQEFLPKSVDLPIRSSPQSNSPENPSFHENSRTNRYQDICPSLLSKILNSNGKKNNKNKKSGQGAHNDPYTKKYRIEGRKLVWRSSSTCTVLRVPLGFKLENIWTRKGSPREKPPCFCGATAKYKHPRTLQPYCSLGCYKQIV